MTNARLTRICLPVLVVILMLASSALAEWKEKVLYSFQGGNDGQSPAGGVVFDKAGNLYGATYEGGSTCPSPGCGTIFQLSPGNGGTWTETILYEFNGNQGSYPEGGVITDAKGNLFGTTAYGGSGICLLFGGNVGCGVAYELSPPVQKGGQWTYTILYNFQGGKDGQIPQGNLTLDEAGNIYGATLYGGGYGTCNAPYFQHCGTVFKLSVPKQKGGKWTEEVLHSFKSGTDGAGPNGGLVLDRKRAIYGTTYAGGDDCGDGGCGTVFELYPPVKKGDDWPEKQLHVFADGDDGGARSPSTGVIFDSTGGLYGTTLGTLFRLAPPSKKSGHWEKTTLFAFCNTNGGGCLPEGSLIFDRFGSLYGTTYYGYGAELHGSVFRLKADALNEEAWSIDYLHGFTHVPDGLFPAAGLVFDAHGAVYSTTQEGGAGTGCGNGGCGAVFEVEP
jgi:uncharacterized repeat protein (TIGR03803 family)